MRLFVVHDCFTAMEVLMARFNRLVSMFGVAALTLFFAACGDGSAKRDPGTVGSSDYTSSANGTMPSSLDPANPFAFVIAGDPGGGTNPPPSNYDICAPKVNFTKADCEFRPTFEFQDPGNNRPVVNVPIVKIVSTGFKGKTPVSKAQFILDQSISGVQPNFRITNLENACGLEMPQNNVQKPFTAISVTQSNQDADPALETVITVAEVIIPVMPASTKMLTDFNRPGTLFPGLLATATVNKVTTTTCTPPVVVDHPSRADITRDKEVLAEVCSSNQFWPLHMYGSGFPRTDEAGLSLHVFLQADAARPSCYLFALSPNNWLQSDDYFFGYIWADASSGLWEIPPYRPWDPSNTNVLNEYGQVNPTWQNLEGTHGCDGDVEGRTATIKFVRPKSCKDGPGDETLVNAFTYGSSQGNLAKPNIQYACSTTSAIWNAGGSGTVVNGVGYGVDKKCDSKSLLPMGTNVKTKTADILTLTGQNFRRSSAPVVAPLVDPVQNITVGSRQIHVCDTNCDGSLDYNDMPWTGVCSSTQKPGECWIGGTCYVRSQPPSPRCAYKVPMDMDVTVGGVAVDHSVGKMFAFVDRAKSDLRNGVCTFSDVNGDGFVDYRDVTAAGDVGGTCQRVHIVVPQIAAKKLPIKIGVAVRNPSLDRDEYGRKGALGVYPTAGDKKIQYYGGNEPTCDPDYENCTPVDTIAPEPVQVISAVAKGVDSIEVTFKQVGDDPAGFPNADMPVDHYDLQALAPNSVVIPYPNFLPGEQPSVVPQTTVLFTGLLASTNYCFEATAHDQMGLSSGPYSYANNENCAATDTPPVNPPPCPIHLAADAGGDPTSEIRLNWLDPYENGEWDAVAQTCSNQSGGGVLELDLKYLAGGRDFSDAEFESGVLADGTMLTPLTIPPADPLDPLAKYPPDGNHTDPVDLSAYAPGTTFVFAIRSRDPETGIWSMVSNHATRSTTVPQLQGSGDFVDLYQNFWSGNDTVSTNVENGVHIFPAAGGGLPWIALADPSSGIQLFKIADPRNVRTYTNATYLGDEVGTPLFDEFGDPVSEGPDGYPDILAKDRHFDRTGSGYDCDGAGPRAGTPLSSNLTDDRLSVKDGLTDSWEQVDSLTKCNLPMDPTWKEEIYSAKMVEAGLVNNDDQPDLLIANLSGNGAPDAVYINSGDDLCRNCSRTDVADGIPAFYPPALLPVHFVTNSSGIAKKLSSSRVRLYNVVSDPRARQGGADLVMVMPGQAELTGFTIYSNGCKFSTGPCSSGDFSAVQDKIVLDSLGQPYTPLHCMDVAFPDVNGDGVNDMICMMAEIFVSTGNGYNLLFLGAGIDPVDHLPHFVLQPQSQTFLSNATTLNCSHTFGETARGANGKDYLLVGYNGTLGNASGHGTSCKNRVYSGMPGSSLQEVGNGITTTNLDSCFNGKFADLKNQSHADLLLACKKGGLMFLNDGSDTFSEGGRAFETDGTQQPINYYGGATSVGVGDFDLNGILDVYFGTGALAPSSGGDHPLQQKTSP